MLSKRSDINKHAINWEQGHQSFYVSIHSLGCGANQVH